MVEKKGGHSVEGIFRVSGSKESADALMDVLDTAGDDPNTAAVLEMAGPVVAATALKHWLGELRDPVFPFVLYDEAIAAHRDAEKAHAVCMKLPHASRDLLHTLCGYLRGLSEQMDVTSMGASNLALVFAPNLVRFDPDTVDPVSSKASHNCD